MGGSVETSCRREAALLAKAVMGCAGTLGSGLVRGRTPVQVEEEIRLGSNFPSCYQGCTVGREGGDRLREARRGRVHLRRGADDS